VTKYVNFSDQEIDYMLSQPLARLSTVGQDDQPDVVPLAFEVDMGGGCIWIGGTGDAVASTRKFRNIRRNSKVALVVDDLISLDPFIARSIRVYGLAEPPIERIGLVGPGLYSKVIPTVSWSWNLSGEPADTTWYEAIKTIHRS
jgi:pyridoxamine 5'-phosphate oxidase family protein